MCSSVPKTLHSYKNVIFASNNLDWIFELFKLDKSKMENRKNIFAWIESLSLSLIHIIRFYR